MPAQWKRYGPQLPRARVLALDKQRVPDLQANERRRGQMMFCLLILFVLMLLIPFYLVFKALKDMDDYNKKTHGFYVYSKKYKRSQRFIYRNGKFVPEYILNGEKMEDWLK